MESSNTLQIPFIGLLMAINSIGQASIPAGKLAATSTPATSNSLLHPILGMYALDGKGKALLHCPPGNPALDEKAEYPMLTRQGPAGTLQKLRPSPPPKENPNPQVAPNQFVVYSLTNRPLAIYVGECKSISDNQSGPTPPMIGIIVAPGTRIQKAAKRDEFLLVNGDNRFLITACTGIEGPRFRCLSHPERKVICEFYYYLGYETEEDCQPDPVRPQ